MPQNKHQVRLAVDVGGTFTDVVLETPTGLVTAKVRTNELRPEQGILSGVNLVLEEASIKPEQVDVFIHGTTLATNALIERKGAKTALITTKGFRDSIEIGYENRFDQYDLMIEKPEQLIPRELRFTVPERMDFSGQVLLELDSRVVLSLMTEIEKNDIESIQVKFTQLTLINDFHSRRTGTRLTVVNCRHERLRCPPLTTD